MNMKKLKILLLPLLFCALAFTISAQPITSPQIDALVERTLKTFDVPGIAVAVVKDGKIIFYRRDAMSTMKNVTFKKAYCISLHKSFKSEGSVPMVTEILISSNEVKIGNTLFENNWKNS